jgi:bifunctional non-homologous end joining protein LigD
MLPHLRNRPLSFKRWPDAIDGEFFWEKDAPSFTPAWVKRFPVPRREGGPPIEYIVANDARTLTWLAKVGGFEIHPFLHRIPNIEIATHVVFDLDPGEGADILDCAKVALLLREALPLEAYAKVSGSKGIQVYVPLKEGAPHEVTETFARTAAEELARRHPRLVVAKTSKALRRGKVFIDWSQNAGYKTTVAVYSLRATGLVSMPVRWEELKRPRKLTWTPAEALARVRKLGDLFAPTITKRRAWLQPASPVEGRTEKRTEGRAEAAPYIGLPKESSQSGRRLFLVTKTETGNELWLDVRGRFKRFILRPDSTGGDTLIAMPAGDFPIEPDYRRAVVPKRWQGRVTIDDSGAYEVVEGSWPRKHLRLWFTGRVMSGQWTLEKIDESDAHRSWRLRK